MKTLRTKTCAACRAPLPLQSFGQSAQTRDGLKTLCRDCTRDYFRGWKARRVAAHSRWLGEHGLAWRGPGVRVSARALSGSAQGEP